jgi:uncharacterized protein (DUF2267 family)
VDVAAVEAVATSALATGRADLYLVDETGRMECLSPGFVEAMQGLLDGDSREPRRAAGARARVAASLIPAQEEQMTTQTFYRTVMDTRKDRDLKAAKDATAAVFHALRDRLTPNEADQVVAQLPLELKSVWEEGEESGRRPLKMHLDEFLERVRREAALTSTPEARWMTLAVFAALKKQLSPGETGDVFDQLPQDLKEIWSEA